MKFFYNTVASINVLQFKKLTLKRRCILYPIYSNGYENINMQVTITTTIFMKSVGCLRWYPLIAGPTNLFEVLKWQLYNLVDEFNRTWDYVFDLNLKGYISSSTL